MSKKEKYTPNEVVKQIVDTLKPKIKTLLKNESLKKDIGGFGTLIGGGTTAKPSIAPTGATSSAVRSGSATPAPTPKPPVAKGEMPDHKTAPVSHFVDMIMSKEYEVQDVMKMVPKDKRDEVLAAIRKKGGKKTYKGGLKKYQMKKNCGMDHSKKK